MSTGKAKHDAYHNALNLLGKDLTRRAKSRCELSGESGSLVIFDLEGAKVEPSLEHVVLVSHTVRDLLDGIGLKDQPLHFLETAVWSAETPIRRAAVRILEQVDEPWARDAIDNAHMMDESTQNPDD